jgi:hypothetical protein
MIIFFIPPPPEISIFQYNGFQRDNKGKKSLYPEQKPICGREEGGCGGLGPPVGRIKLGFSYTFGLWTPSGAD